MNTPPPRLSPIALRGGIAQWLTDLESVTLEYANGNTVLFGLAAIVAGLLLLSGGLAAVGERQFLGAALALAAAPAMVLTSAFTRRHYQRLGVVAPPDPRTRGGQRMSSRWLAAMEWGLLGLWILSALYSLGTDVRDHGLGTVLATRLALLLSFASAVATGALLWWRRPSRWDALWFFVVVIGQQASSGFGQTLGPRIPDVAELGRQALEASRPGTEAVWMTFIEGTFLLVAGLGTHWAHRRTEARLAALRAAAAASFTPEAPPPA